MSGLASSITMLRFQDVWWRNFNKSSSLGKDVDNYAYLSYILSPHDKPNINSAIWDCFETYYTHYCDDIIPNDAYELPVCSRW